MMSFLGDIKRGIDSVFHPDRNTKTGMSLGRALSFYYEFSILPFITFVIVASLMLYLNAAVFNTVPFLSMLYGSTLGVVAVAIAAVLLFWILVPIGFLINAAIYQVVGKYFLKVWKGDYSKTFMATMFGSLPIILFYWLMPIPILGAIAIAVFAIWSFVVLIIALSNAQKVSRLQSVGVVLISAAVIFIIVFIFAAMGYASLSTFMPSGFGVYNVTPAAGHMIPYP